MELDGCHQKAWPKLKLTNPKNATYKPKDASNNHIRTKLVELNEATP
jgi:hypothetical protein